MKSTSILNLSVWDKFRFRKIMGLNFYWIVFLLLILSVLVAKNLYRRTSTPPIPTHALPIKVQTIRATEGPGIPLVIETIGNLTAQREIKIKSPGPARVGKILVSSGQKVCAGTELISLLGGVEIRAPFGGTLGDWLVKPGALVSAGSELVDLVDTDHLSITYRVPEHYAPELKLHQEVLVQSRHKKEASVKGIVNFISPSVDRKTYTIQVQADIENSEQNFWPGMSVHVTHFLSKPETTLVIPESALKLTLEGYETMVVEGDKLVRRKVTVGSRYQGRVQIISGLQSGEHVLLTRTDITAENISVVPVEWQGAW